MPWSPVQRAVLQGVTTGTATLGALGACALLALFWNTRRMHRSAVARIVAAMAIADLISALSKAIGRLAVDRGSSLPFCQAQAAFMQLGDLSSILWTLTISINLLLITYFRHSVGSIQRYERLYAVLCFGLPFISALIPLFLRVPNPDVSSGKPMPIYGDADMWCWVSHGLILERAVLMYVPLGLVFIANLIVYVLVGLRVYRTARLLVQSQNNRSANASDDAARKFSAPKLTMANPEHAARVYMNAYLRNTLLYLASFLFTWGPSVLSRFITFVTPHDHVTFVVYIVMGVCSPLRGLTNFLVYVYVNRVSPSEGVGGSGETSSNAAAGQKRSVTAANPKSTLRKVSKQKRRLKSIRRIDTANAILDTDEDVERLNVSPLDGDGLSWTVTPASPLIERPPSLPDLWIHEVSDARQPTKPSPSLQQQRSIGRSTPEMLPNSVSGLSTPRMPASLAISSMSMASTCRGTPSSWRNFDQHDIVLGSVGEEVEADESELGSYSRGVLDAYAAARRV